MLCSRAAFRDTTPSVTGNGSNALNRESTIPPVVIPPVLPPGSQHVSLHPGITINIELQLPATNDPKIYDSLFAAMKKHLFNDS